MAAKPLYFKLTASCNGRSFDDPPAINIYLLIHVELGGIAAAETQELLRALRTPQSVTT